MKHQALFSSKDRSKKKLKCCLLQCFFGALRVKIHKLAVRKTQVNKIS